MLKRQIKKSDLDPRALRAQHIKTRRRSSGVTMLARATDIHRG
jgi:hypothetical protein